jgi:hypothetical protein
MSVFEKTVFVARQEVGDVKDVALASELFARVSRRPPSDERTAQMRTLHTLIEEFMDDQANDDDLRPAAVADRDVSADSGTRSGS